MTQPRARGPVAGSLPSLREASRARRQRDQVHRVLSTSLLLMMVIIAAVAATTGVLSSTNPAGDQQAANAVKAPEDPTKVVVKRPLPEGMTEEGVVKWVPIRQPSGRTELEAWTSVDHHWAEMPQIADEVMATDRTLERGESTSEWPIDNTRSKELIEAH